MTGILIVFLISGVFCVGRFLDESKEKLLYIESDEGLPTEPVRQSSGYTKCVDDSNKESRETVEESRSGIDLNALHDEPSRREKSDKLLDAIASGEVELDEL